MNLAKATISTPVPVPLEIKGGASSAAIREAQAAFAGAAEALGMADEDGIQALVDDTRQARGRQRQGFFKPWLEPRQ